ncbi:conjugal transfer protein TrbL family protein [Sphaerisporangium sp. NPDC051017]|uniref:conjugal transfer protein TrbL family protein n=1 Tax=unclassified Sphaerisporangium TaxID=2630420 RepID=UPI0034018ABE
MPCDLPDVLGCAGDLVGGGVTSIAGSAFNAVVQSFVSAANTLLEGFGKAFVAIPPVDLTSPGVRSVYQISLKVAGVIAVLLLLGQVIKTAITHDGSALAQGLIGVGKAALAFMLTLVIAGTSLKAADEITNYIVVRSFGSTRALTARITSLIPWSSPATAGALILLLAVVGILLTLVLWFELLLRNVAIVVLVATSPIAAAGQVSGFTTSWWTKFAVATVQLIILKPVIALVFALGFGMTGKSEDIQSILAGMLVLILAVFAWPAIARFFSFASVAVGGSAGLGSLVGFAAGRAGGGGPGGGVPTGIDPDEFSQASEARTMASFGQSGGGASAAGGAGGSAAAGAGPAAVAVAALRGAQKAINSLSGGMDQMATHAGMGGRPAGYAAGVPPYAGQGRYRRPYGAGTSAPGSGSAGGTPPAPVPGSGALGKGEDHQGSSQAEPPLPQASAAERPADTPAEQTAPQSPALPDQPALAEALPAPPRPKATPAGDGHDLEGGVA